jgi:putative methyltransferase (TIGR04325 family)
LIKLIGIEIINKLKNSVINLLKAKPKLFDIYPNYEKALEGGLGYDEKKLIKVIVAKALAFKKNLSINNNLDLSISRTAFALSLLYKKSSLTILDFGGGAGTHYTLAKKLLGDKVSIKWHVVETETMVNEAKNNNLENEELKFFKDIDSAIDHVDNFDLIYANSSLTYTDDPMEYLNKLLNTNFDLFYITRTPMNEKSKENIVGIQSSRLSTNGQGNIPESLDIEDEVIKYPFTIISKSAFEETIKKKTAIKFFIREEVGSYQTKAGNFRMFGYVLNKLN